MFIFPPKLVMIRITKNGLWGSASITQSLFGISRILDCVYWMVWNWFSPLMLTAVKSSLRYWRQRHSQESIWWRNVNQNTTNNSLSYILQKYSQSESYCQKYCRWSQHFWGTLSINRLINPRICTKIRR